jgi:hypothetical protein
MQARRRAGLRRFPGRASVRMSLSGIRSETILQGGWAPPNSLNEAEESDRRHLVAAADGLDNWIRRHAVEWYCGKTSSAKFNPSRDRVVGLSAIGKSLRDQYDALSPPIPPRLATLIEQLETKK